jgi:hypothetical protein
MCCRHQRALNTRIQRAGLQQGLATMRDRAKQVVTGVMPTLLMAALWLVVENIPGVKFPSLLSLLVTVGAVQLSHKYNHTRYFWSCLFALSEVLLLQQLARVELSPYFSIIMDSSTDISSEDHVLIYVQYLSVPSFRVCVEYLCTIKVGSKTADIVIAALRTVLTALQLNIKNMVGFCADGGSEYAGKHNGVAAQLKRDDVPYLITTHCAAHRAALVMGDQVKSQYNAGDDMTLDAVDQMLRGVHGLFAKSPKRQAQWKKFAARYGVTRFKFPIFNTTRWFSRYDCLVVLTANLPVLLLFLEKYKERWLAADSMYELLHKAMAVGLLMCMRDIMSVMQHLNTELQKDGVMPHAVRQLTTETCDHLKRMVNTSGSCLVPDKELMPWFHNFTIVCEGMTGRWRFHKHRSVYLDLPGFTFTKCVEFVLAMADHLVERIDHRFPNAHVMRAFRVLDPATYRGMRKSDALDGKGGLKEEFILLSKHFNHDNLSMKLFDIMGTTATAVELAAEWKRLRGYMVDLITTSPDITMQAAWALIASQDAVKFPHALRLAYVAFSIPMQSASVERGFSMHRVIKHRLTNSLRLITLDSLMRMKLLVHHEEDEVPTFDIDAAVGVITDTGMHGNKKPLMIGQLFKAACDIDMPVSLEDGVDCNDEAIDFDAFNLDSDVESEGWTVNQDVDENMSDVGTDAKGGKEDDMDVGDVDEDAQALEAAMRE